MTPRYYAGFSLRRIYHKPWDWTKDQDWHSNPKSLAAKHYMIDRAFTGQTIPDSRVYLPNKVWDENTRSMKTAMKPKYSTLHKRDCDSKVERKCLIVVSKAWNERYLEYEWNGHEYGDKRKQTSLNSWTLLRRAVKHNERSSSLCSIVKSQKDAYHMRSILLSSMRSRSITSWMETCKRNGWMRSEPRRTFASRTMMKGDNIEYQFSFFS